MILYCQDYNLNRLIRTISSLYVLKLFNTLIFYHIYSSDMSLIIWKFSIQECINYLQCMSRSYYSCTHSENICIVMFSCCLCAESIVAKCSSYSFNFIGGYGNSYSCSTDKYSFLTLTTNYCICNFFCINRIITWALIITCLLYTSPSPRDTR